MDDLISRQAAIDALDEYIEEYSFDLDENGYHNPKWCAMQEAKMTIQRLPSAERRGRWEHLGHDEWFCTACAHVITTEGSWERPWQKYCEECGARMEVE